MLTKEEICHKFFNDIKPKHLSKFEAQTPKGNFIKGFICKKPNRFLGSMLITEVYFKEKETLVENLNQFVHAMPKINYYDYHHSMKEESLINYPIFEKLDGSCLILFGLYYDGKLMEVVPKTRGIPVADKHIIEMYNEIDHSNIEIFFKEFHEANPTLLFELYGALNQHSIFYPKTRIDIALIGGSYDSRLLDWHELYFLKKQYDFERPFCLFNLVFYNNTWKIRVKPGIFYHYLFKTCSKDQIDKILQREYPTQLDVIQAIKSMITRINKNYSEEHNRQLLEGGVINTYNQTGEYFLYLKVKSADIEEKCRTENGVPRKFILKEIQKYFDEYGSQAKEIYQKDENHVIEYVNRNLLEEFDIVAVEMKRTQTRIKNIFLDMLEAKEPPKGLQELCQELVEKYPNSEISDLMRLFAQEYPEKKKHARIAYSIFEKII